MGDETQDWSSSATFEPGTVVLCFSRDGSEGAGVGVVIGQEQGSLIVEQLMSVHRRHMAWCKMSLPFGFMVFIEAPVLVGRQGAIELMVSSELINGEDLDAFMHFIQDNLEALKAALQNPDDRVFVAALSRLKELDKDMLESTLQDYANRWRASSRDDGFTDRENAVYDAITDKEWLKSALTATVDEQEYAALIARIDDVDWLMSLLTEDGLPEPVKSFDVELALPGRHGFSRFVKRMYELDPSPARMNAIIDFLVRRDHYLAAEARRLRAET